MDFHDWIEEFQFHLKQQRRSKWTIRQYTWHLEKLADALAEDQDIHCPTQITRKHIRRWGAKLAGKYAKATHKQAAAALRVFFRFLKNEGVIERNPAENLPMPRPSVKSQRTLDAEEVKKLLGACTELPSPRQQRELALISFLTDSGLRAGEVCKLCWEDVNPEHGYVRTIGKGDDEEFAFFGKRTTIYLLRWAVTRRRWLWKRDLDDTGHVFVSLGGLTPGEQLTTRGLRSIVKKLGRLADVPGVSPHVFRRTFATLMAENDAPTRTIQLAGRWNDIDMVQRYTRALESHIRRLHSLYAGHSPIDQLDWPIDDDGDDGDDDDSIDPSLVSVSV